MYICGQSEIYNVIEYENKVQYFIGVGGMYDGLFKHKDRG